jgi:hypothetical protein
MGGADPALDIAKAEIEALLNAETRAAIALGYARVTCALWETRRGSTPPHKQNLSAAVR